MNVCKPSDKTQFREALGVLLERADLSPAERDEHIDALLRYADRRNLSLDHCLIAQEQGRILAACLCVDSPGRMASVFIPSLPRFLKPPTAMVGLLTESARLARQRNIQILQGTLAPEATLEAGIYRRAGFQRLTRLIYMDSDLTQSIPSAPPAMEVTWETYDPTRHELFARVVRGTYEDSLDCVALNGVRDIEDILASHRAAGVFCAESWLVARVAGEPMGVILLSHLPERWAYEIVYMGVLPALRGRRFGATLLRRAVEVAREQAVNTLSLSVDAGNVPAQRLYRRFGFRETSRRDVWLAML